MGAVKTLSELMKRQEAVSMVRWDAARADEMFVAR